MKKFKIFVIVLICIFDSKYLKFVNKFLKFHLRPFYKTSIEVILSKTIFFYVIRPYTQSFV